MKLLILVFCFSYLVVASESLDEQQNKFYDWKINEVNIKFKESEHSHLNNISHQTSQQEDILHDNIQQNVIDASQVIFNAN